MEHIITSSTQGHPIGVAVLARACRGVRVTTESLLPECRSAARLWQATTRSLSTSANVRTAHVSNTGHSGDQVTLVGYPTIMHRFRLLEMSSARCGGEREPGKA